MVHPIAGLAADQKDLYCTLLTILALADGDVSLSELHLIDTLFAAIKPTVKLDWNFIESVSLKNRSDVLKKFKTEVFVDRKIGFFLLAEMFLLAIIHNNIDRTELAFIKEVAQAFQVEEVIIEGLYNFAQKILPAIQASDQSEFENLLKNSVPELGYIPPSSVLTGMLAGAVAGIVFSPVGSVIGVFAGVFANSVRNYEAVELNHLVDLYRALIVSTEVVEANSLSISLATSGGSSLRSFFSSAISSLDSLNPKLGNTANEKENICWKEFEFFNRKSVFSVGKINLLEDSFEGLISQEPRTIMVRNYLVSSEVLVIPVLSKYSINAENLSTEDKINAFKNLKIDNLKNCLRLWTKGKIGKKFDCFLIFVPVDFDLSTNVSEKAFKESLLNSPYAGLIETFTKEGGKEPVFSWVNILNEGKRSVGSKFGALISSALLRKSRSFNIDDNMSFGSLLSWRG